MPGLLSAQHVAGASQFQIKSGDAKPSAQLGKLANCCQPSSRNRRKLLLSGNQKISISAAIRPSHAPAQLIKLRKTVSIGAIYDDGVCARDVYAVLDNRGRDERVIFVINEIEHHALHLFFIHLAVAHGNPRLRYEPLHERRDRLDRLDAIVNEKDLPAPGQLKFDSGLDHEIR